MIIAIVNCVLAWVLWIKLNDLQNEVDNAGKDIVQELKNLNDKNEKK